MSTLEELLRMEVESNLVADNKNKTVHYSPEFRVSVQEKTDEVVRIIINADGHNSDTLDFVVKGNTLIQL
jgi:hypothetical protein